MNSFNLTDWALRHRWVPPALRVVMMVLRHVPTVVFRRLPL